MLGKGAASVLGAAGALGATASPAGAEAAIAGPTPTFWMRVLEVDYTPPPSGPGLVMGGYGWVERKNNGVTERRLRAQCMTFHDGRGSNDFIMLRVDVISIPREVFQRIMQHLLDEGWLGSPAELLIVSSHTHSGPMVGDRPDAYVLQGVTGADLESVADFTEIFVNTMIDLVRRTLSMPATPVTLGYAEGLGFLAYNRSRIGRPAAPPDVSVLLARHADTGVPVAVLFGHSCHPVCRPGPDKVFDSDHCGYAAEMISNRLGIPALFFQGAAGDLNPLPGRPTPMTGGGLADAVVAMVRNGAFHPVNGPIQAAREEILLPLNVDDDGIEELRGRYEARLGDDGHVGRHAERMIELFDSGTLPRHIPMIVQRWELNGLRILALSHEVTSTYHVGTKAWYRLPLWIIGYANYVDCYVPGDELSWAGGYEAGWDGGDNSIAFPGTASMSYSWPAPLRASDVGQTPPDPSSAEGLVRAAIARLM